MIIDKVKNISNYKNIPVEAIKFINGLNEMIDLGRYELGNGIFANVEKYQTKLTTDAKFEAHNDYVDIQILLRGRENIFITGKDKLEVAEPYDENRDICFYSNPITGSFSVMLGFENFVVLFPHEAHAPQVSIEERQEEVLKVVVKIPLKLFL